MKVEEIENEIKEILNEKGKLKFQYAFQPIYEIENFGNVYSCEIIGYEALLRNSEKYGKNILELLNFFIKAKKGFKFHLYLLHLALYNFKNILKNKIYLFFNISPEIFIEEEFDFKHFVQILDHYNFTCKNIVFEITENYPNEIYDFLIFQISKIKNTYENIFFAIDDFGTGNNNGKFFTDLQPGFLKIDRYFIQSSKDFLFLKKMTDFFSDYCKIILEGIETEEQFFRCLNTRATLYQGYYLNKPFIFN